MGSTNSTVNYSLSQFIGTDKPSWLNDYDNDMFKIDAQMKLNATAAAAAKTTADTADGKADANTLAIGTLDTQINTAGTGLAAQVSTNTTAIGTIDGSIGDTPLTTVAQTLTGAIEEVKASVPSVTGLLGFTGVKTLSVTADNTKTFATLLNELHAALLTYLATKGADYRFQFATISIYNYMESNVEDPTIYSNSFSSIAAATSISLSTVHAYIFKVRMMASNSELFRSLDGTVADISSTTMASGTISLKLNEFSIA